MFLNVNEVVKNYRISYTFYRTSWIYYCFVVIYSQYHSYEYYNILEIYILLAFFVLIPHLLRNWTPHKIIVIKIQHGISSHEYIGSINLHSEGIVHISGNDMIKMVLIAVNTQTQRIWYSAKEDPENVLAHYI